MPILTYSNEMGTKSNEMETSSTEAETKKWRNGAKSDVM